MSTNKILGVGGFGLVIAVYDKELKTDLAIKVTQITDDLHLDYHQYIKNQSLGFFEEGSRDS